MEIPGGAVRWAFVIALTAAAGASAWALYHLDFEESVAAETRSDAPDAYMEHFTTVEMDNAGKPKRRLEADYMAYMADETIVLFNPYYVLYRADGEPWHIRSERGEVSADGNILHLLGNVAIWRTDGAGVRELDIRTEDLMVLPDSEYGETTKPVTIRMPASTSQGVGMRAYLDETRIELLSKVRTHVDGYRPKD